MPILGLLDTFGGVLWYHEDCIERVLGGVSQLLETVDCIIVTVQWYLLLGRHRAQIFIQVIGWQEHLVFDHGGISL